MSTLGKRELSGFEIFVNEEHFPENPFTEPKLVKLVQFHRKYGQQHGFENPAAVRAYAKKSGAVLVDVNLYDHSALLYSTNVSSSWDSGQVGFVLFEKPYVTEISKAECAKPDSKHAVLRLKGIADSLLADYTEYANGWVYELVITSPGGDIDDPLHQASSLYGDSGVEKEIELFMKHQLQLQQPPPASIQFTPRQAAFV